MSRGRRIGIPLGIAAGVLVVAAVVALVWQPWRSTATTTSASSKPQTVTALRTTLTSDLVLSGTLSYGDVIDLPGRQGTITGLPTAGHEVSSGQELYEVDGHAVIAVSGARPFWRALAQGMTDGPDVQQLEQALSDLGYGSGITIDQHFSSATASALKKWQRALGLPVTGMVALGDVVAIDAPSVRVASVGAKLGDQAGQSPLSYTSTVLGVAVTLTDAQVRQILAGTKVIVTLPDGTKLPGSIDSTDPGGQPTGTAGDTTSPSAVVRFDDPTKASGIGLRAVKVTLANQTVEDALVIPVTALVATLDGGYAVDVIRDKKTIRVPVKLGLIADTRVQVTGGALRSGDLVVVAQ